MSGDKSQTRHLGLPPDATPMPQRITGPLDELIPWVIEFRVVGTAYIIQAPAAESMIIGRSDPRRDFVPDVDLTPYAAHVLGVSRRHARVSVTANRVTVEDMDSANGTFLNEHVLTPGEPYRLRHGDQLSLGQLHLQVQFVVTPVRDDQEQSEGGVEIPVLGKGQHVLVVDDDADVARIFSSILEHAGFQVTTVTNAVDALNHITNAMPDAIIMELVLPDMNGLELIRYVRKQESGANLPMIAISSASGGYHMNQARDIGVNVILSKPLSVDEIVEALRSIAGEIGQKM